jgi:hypothetical protein
MVDTTGSPCAIASASAIPYPSKRDASTNTSDAKYSSTIRAGRLGRPLAGGGTDPCYPYMRAGNTAKRLFCDRDQQRARFMNAIERL